MTLDNQRRRLLKYGGVVAGTALAGCTGGDGGDGGGEGGDGSDGGDGAGGADGGGGDGTDSGDEGGDGGTGGTVQMYGIDEFETRALGEGLQEEHDISVETTVLLGGENSGRYIREHNQGVHEADVVQGFDENFIALIDHEDDLIADPELPNFDAVWTDEYLTYLSEQIFNSEEAARQMVPLGGFLSSFAYNENLTEEPPETWDDLLAPRFEDEIILLTYNISGIWDHYGRHYGDDAADEFIQDLDEQNPQYISGSPIQAAQQVGAGQAKLAPDSFVAHVAMLQADLPLSWTWPEFIWRQYWGMMLMENAPNFDAAKTFCQYAASQDGQERFSQLFGGCLAAHEDVPHGNSTAEERLAEYDGEIRNQAQWDEREQLAEQRVDELIGVGGG